MMVQREEIVEQVYVYRGKVVTLRLDEVRLASGATARREIVEHRPAVAVAAVDDHDRVLLIRQYRLAVDEVLTELPAGVLEPDEDPEAGARRELQEETGIRAREFQSLGGFYSAPGFCTEYIHLYVATGLEIGEAHPEADEDIETSWVPIDSVLEMIESGNIHDAKTVGCLLRLLINRGR